MQQAVMSGLKYVQYRTAVINLLEYLISQFKEN